MLRWKIFLFCRSQQNAINLNYTAGNVCGKLFPQRYWAYAFKILRVLWSLTSRFLYRYHNSRSKEKLGFRTAKQNLETSGTCTLPLTPPPPPPPPGKLGNLALPIQINRCQRKNSSHVQCTRAQFVPQHDDVTIQSRKSDTQWERLFNTIFSLSYGSAHRLFMVRRENVFSTFCKTISRTWFAVPSLKPRFARVPIWKETPPWRPRFFLSFHLSSIQVFLVRCDSASPFENLQPR